MLIICENIKLIEYYFLDISNINQVMASENLPNIIKLFPNELSSMFNESELVNILMYYYINMIDQCEFEILGTIGLDRFNYINLLLLTTNYKVEVTINQLTMLPVVTFFPQKGFNPFRFHFSIRHQMYNYDYTKQIITNTREIVKHWCYIYINKILNHPEASVYYLIYQQKSDNEKEFMSKIDGLDIIYKALEKLKSWEPIIIE